MKWRPERERSPGGLTAIQYQRNRAGVDDDRCLEQQQRRDNDPDHDKAECDPQRRHVDSENLSTLVRIAPSLVAQHGTTDVSPPRQPTSRLQHAKNPEIQHDSIG